ncbi:kappa-scoloptoxin(11)-Ss1a-like [Daktulosphaira vitifoliae]|uniref:kappa-scoloptoxin(11)-Ss1a-like n=1 Tax=Daktulosphaira vitifoliae TaxID=58002 RepID=UPI0021A9CE30|nr:kappa-scoloptoxin(11)-Ss1a-like [Daktulosphaira vitifoliae]
MAIIFLIYIFTANLNVYEATLLIPVVSSEMENKAIYLYPGQTKSERDLNICEQYSVCNIVHLRFWFPPQIERLCKCPNREECPWKWSTDDKRTMLLNNRSQLKFCEPVYDLPDCTNKFSESITIERHKEDNNIQVKAKVQCYCPQKTTWELIRHNQNDHHNTTIDKSYIKDMYKCKKLKDCNASEFCGYIRTDYFSTYTKCSCPYGNLCLHKDKNEISAYEMFFHGMSYRAECTPYPQT